MNSLYYMDDLYGSFRNKTFSECYPDVNTFINDLAETQIPLPVKQENLKVLYYLLISRYANNPIASSDVNRFKFNVASIIFQFGGTWQKRLEIQQTLRDLTEEEIMSGAKQIYNRAYNPSGKPSTDTVEEIPYVNEQTVSKNKRSKIDGYAYLWDLLDTDVTGDFLKQFKKLFIYILQSEQPLLYKSED